MSEELFPLQTDKHFLTDPKRVFIRPPVCLSVNFLHFHLLLQNHWSQFQLNLAYSISKYGDSIQFNLRPKVWKRKKKPKVYWGMTFSPNLGLPCFKFARTQKHLHLLLYMNNILNSSTFKFHKNWQVLVHLFPIIVADFTEI